MFLPFRTPLNIKLMLPWNEPPPGSVLNCIFISARATPYSLKRMISPASIAKSILSAK